MGTIETPFAVLVVEDDSIVRDWLRTAFRGTEFRVAGEAATSAEALEMAARRHADLLLVDHRLDTELGTDLVRSLRKEGNAAPAVLMTADPLRGLNETAREAGIQGSIVKTADREQLLAVLRSVLEGRGYYDPAHPKRRDGEAALAPRERDVIRLVAAGKTNKEAARELGIGEESVKTMLERAYTKLGAHRRAEAVLEARRRGIV
jgi:DNA-binding NarL/FixJ family response regulator